MTGILSGVLITLGVTVLLAGTVLGLAVAGDPMAVDVAVGLGVSGLFAALCAYLRPRPFRLPALEGANLRLMAFLSVNAVLSAGAFACPPRCLAATAALGPAGVLGVLWCGVSRRHGKAEQGHARWTDDDLDWLNETGATLPEATERQP